MSESVPLLLMDVGRHRCAVEGANVERVVRACSVVPLAGAPAFVEGAINLHGEVVPVVDLRRRLGLPVRPVDPDEHFVVCASRGRKLALRVDRAIDLISVAPEAVSAPHELSPDTVVGALATPDGLLFIHDLHRFLTEAEEAEVASLLPRPSS